MTQDLESDVAYKTEQYFSGATGATLHGDTIDYIIEFGYSPSYKDHTNGTTTHNPEIQTYALGCSKKWSEQFQTRAGYSYSLSTGKGYTDLMTLGLVQKLSYVEMGFGLFGYHSKMKSSSSSENNFEEHYRFYGFQVGSTVYY